MLIFLQPDHNMKSFTHRFRGLADPHIAVHGSFSVMVNYHAIGLYCTSRFGFVLHDPQLRSLKLAIPRRYPSKIHLIPKIIEQVTGPVMRLSDFLRSVPLHFQIYAEPFTTR